MICHNKHKTCWNCPAAVLKGNVDFRACGQTKEEIEQQAKDNPDMQVVITCKRRPSLGYFEPGITFEECPEYIETEYGYMLRNMRVMILGIDGYLGWTLALKLARLGCRVFGVDNFLRRDMVSEKGSHTGIPICRMTERLRVAASYGLDIDFRRIDIRDEISKLREYLSEVKPESIIHYAEIPSAPYSMVDSYHALDVQDNNTLGTLGLLFAMKDIVPETCMIKLGTMGEYGAPLSGRPIFEGLFPADAVLEWDDRKWSLGGEMTPRNPASFYHVGKVQDTYNVYEACRYWWLRSYDIMQGVIYGVSTDELSMDKRLRTRFDFDEWFGTVINRFVVQAVLGIPLTIYGKGEQIRGFIGLDDAMQCMIRLMVCPPEPGQYDVVNQVTAVYRICDLAEAVAEVGEEFGLKVQVNRVSNPRVEPDRHPMEVVSKKLEGDFGLKAKVCLYDEIRRMMKVLLEPEVLQRLKDKQSVIAPVTRWNGEKKHCDLLEEYAAGSKQLDKELKQQLDRMDGRGEELSSIEKKKQLEEDIVVSD